MKTSCAFGIKRGGKSTEQNYTGDARTPQPSSGGPAGQLPLDSDEIALNQPRPYL